MLFHTFVRTTINIVDNNALSYGGDFVLGVSFRRGDFVRGDFVRTPVTAGIVLRRWPRISTPLICTAASTASTDSVRGVGTLWWLTEMDLLDVEF